MIIWSQIGQLKSDNFYHSSLFDPIQFPLQTNNKQQLKTITTIIEKLIIIFKNNNNRKVNEN